MPSCEEMAWVDCRLAWIFTVVVFCAVPLKSVTFTVVVANFPIDRTQLVYPFEVLEDGVPLTETTHYTVDEAQGEITFVGSKPEDPGSGEVYTINYAHPADPAAPAHGTLVDVTAFTNVDGVAETRVSYPDDADLVGQIDELQADTFTT